ncbi:hypothetical protein P9112_006001 [Eukaryota sp. TZLM1-RC]
MINHAILLIPLLLFVTVYAGRVKIADKNCDLTVKQIALKNNTFPSDRAYSLLAKELKLHDFSNLLFDCVDGRNDLDHRIGTFGGSLGEFILAVSGLVKLQPFRKSLSVEAIMQEYLDADFQLYLHSDDHAVQDLHHYLQQQGYSDVDILNPPEDLQPLLLDLLSDPQYIGCGHIKLLLLNPLHGADADIIIDSIRSFYNFFWARHPNCHYHDLTGHHEEEAVLLVSSSDLKNVPTFKFRTSEYSTFIYHKDAASILRARNAKFFSKHFDINADLLFTQISVLATYWGDLTVFNLANDLTLYEVNVRIMDPLPQELFVGLGCGLVVVLVVFGVWWSRKRNRRLRVAGLLSDVGEELLSF